MTIRSIPDDLKVAYDQSTTDDLAEFFHNITEEIIYQREIQSYLGFLLKSRLIDDNAERFTTISSIDRRTTIQIDLEYKIEYDPAVLNELLEDERLTKRLVDDDMFEPEHNEVVTVKDKWNVVKLKKLLKEGDRYADVLERARKITNPNSPRVKSKAIVKKEA